MPEIGEIRAHAERLADEFGGRVLDRFRPITFHVLKTFSPDPDEAVGRPLVGTRTRGKYLYLDFESIGFIVHLMQGGRLRPDDKQAAKPRNGQARWRFEDGSALLLTEAGSDKRAGVWVVAGDDTFESFGPLADLGPEADAITPEQLAEILNANSMRLHGLLRRQGIIAGLGRRLANDICHEARLSPFASTGKLDGDQVDRLHSAIGTCIERSLRFERDQNEIVGSAKRPSAVHKRTGEPCPRCGDEIREVTYTKYQVHYCPTCQTSGRILADNTTSKFLK